MDEQKLRRHLRRAIREAREDGWRAGRKAGRVAGLDEAINVAADLWANAMPPASLALGEAIDAIDALRAKESPAQAEAAPSTAQDSTEPEIAASAPENGSLRLEVGWGRAYRAEQEARER